MPPQNSALQKKLRTEVKQISIFCDVCGHRTRDGHPLVTCSKCPSSFHTICLGGKSKEVAAAGWTCHTCAAVATNFHHRVRNPTSPPETRQNWRPCPKAHQCSSCGHPEREAILCHACTRWFCFACTCLSATTLPSKAWSCPECVGLKCYDKARQLLIAVSRQRVHEGTATTAEEDGFSQLVFDLLCACNWVEFERNIRTLITLVTKQLRNGKLPAVAPFHSLHYVRLDCEDKRASMDTKMVCDISKAYARHAQQEALKKLSATLLIKLRKGGPYVRNWTLDNLRMAADVTARRLRIGYLSSDFVNHPTLDLFLMALLKHNKLKFEIFCYSISQTDKSELRMRISSGVEHFRHFATGSSDHECAQRNTDDGIHILVNLNGHTAGERNGISTFAPCSTAAGVPGLSRHHGRRLH